MDLLIDNLSKLACIGLTRISNDCHIVIHRVSCHKLLTLIALTLLLASPAEAKIQTAPKCSICKDIVSNFHKSLSSTAKSNYGGGNTKWEEKSLGSYATSEVRLVEIIEKLCEDGSKECHTVLEEYEELVERYWFKEFAQKKDTDFYVYLCIDHMKACCPSNTFGKDCSECTGGVHRPCSGNGYCNGEGTREGTGKCICHTGYQGEYCNQCKDGFYKEASNETHTSCKVCHIACKNICTEAGPKGCDACKQGWQETEEEGCQDVNECLEDPCEENQYCINTQGSFTCFSCDDACTSCSGPGADKCEECHSGFTRGPQTDICVDNDECALDSNLCEGENKVCQNVPGSYECVCKSGYIMKDIICVKAPKEDGKDEEDTNKPVKEKNVNEEL